MHFLNGVVVDQADAEHPTDAKIATWGFVENGRINIKAVVHEADEGGYWLDVPAIPGRATQDKTMELI